ncbi:hypothetical protein YC2023_033361 [Brassica napus]
MDKEEPMSSFSGSAKETVRAAILRFPKNFDRRISFVLQHTARILRGVRKIWNIIGIPLNLDLPKLLNVLYMDRVNYYAGKIHLNRISILCGYFLLPDEAKSRHNIRTANLEISPHITRTSPITGYLYNFQTREFYNLSCSQ